MPTAFERGAQKGFDRMSGFLLTDKSAGHYEYVGIIVLACETCYLFLPAQSGPYSLMFIECHGYSVSGSADGYSGIYFAGFYSFGKRMGVVGIITTFSRVGSIGMMEKGLNIYTALDMGITNKSFDEYEQTLIRDTIRARISRKMSGEQLFC